MFCFILVFALKFMFALFDSIFSLRFNFIWIIYLMIYVYVLIQFVFVFFSSVWDFMIIFEMTFYSHRQICNKFDFISPKAICLIWLLSIDYLKIQCLQCLKLTNQFYQIESQKTKKMILKYFSRINKLPLRGMKKKN